MHVAARDPCGLGHWGATQPRRDPHQTRLKKISASSAIILRYLWHGPLDPWFLTAPWRSWGPPQPELWGPEYCSTLQFIVRPQHVFHCPPNPRDRPRVTLGDPGSPCTFDALWTSVVGPSKFMVLGMTAGEDCRRPWGSGHHVGSMPQWDAHGRRVA